MKIKKRSDKNETSSTKTKKITYESQKRKSAKLHLEHTGEIKRCKEVIKNKKSQKSILEHELRKASHAKWINADIIRDEINNIDKIVEKSTTWINHLQAANRQIIKLLEIFNPEETEGHNKQNEGQATSVRPHTITISDEEEDLERDQLIQEAQERQKLHAATNAATD